MNPRDANCWRIYKVGAAAIILLTLELNMAFRASRPEDSGAHHQIVLWVTDISSWAMVPLLLSCDTLFGHLRCGNDNCDGPGFDSTDDCCWEGKIQQ